MTIEIKSIDAIIKCDICGIETQLEIDNYSRMMRSYSGNRIKTDVWLKYNTNFPRVVCREFKNSDKLNRKFMLCEKCADSVENMEKQIDMECEKKKDSLIETLWGMSGFKPPIDDPYYK